jgi:hypothetical protein
VIWDLEFGLTQNYLPRIRVWHFSLSTLKLLLFWHEKFMGEGESLYQQGFSTILENLNFLVLTMPGEAF